MRKVSLSNNRKISSVFLIYVYIITTAVVFIFGGFWIFHETVEFRNNSTRLYEHYLQSRKEILQKQTELVIDYIQFSRNNVNAKLENNLKNKVVKANSVALNFYKSYNGKKSDSEIKSLIKITLGSNHFNNDKCQYIIYDMEGKAVLYPTSSEIEGKQLINLTDDKGQEVIKNIIDLAKKNGEGFIKSHWYRSGTKKETIYTKTSYVKHFKPYDWIIVSGCFADDFENEVKKEVLNRIKNIRYGKEGYIFVNTYEGVALVIDSDINVPGDTIWELTDPEGVKVIQKEREAVENPNGDFIYYKWKKLNSDTYSNKISFIKGIPEWKWMVGTGFYLDEIENTVKSYTEVLKKEMRKRILFAVLILISILIVVNITARRISKKIHKNFDQFLNDLNQAVTVNDVIEPAKFDIKDLKYLSNNVNSIISRKKVSENALIESEERFRTIFENSPVMILVFDKNLELKKWNKEAKNKFGSRLAINMNFRDILTSSDVVAKDPNLNLSDIKGQFKEFLIKNNGDNYHQLWASFLTSNNELISVGYDITELKKIQQKLDKANKTKDLFFSIISHDLQSPFNSIIGFTNLLLDDFKQLDDPTKIEYLKQIQESSEGMYKLLLSLLEWSKAQLDNIEMEIREFNLNNTITECISLYQNQADTKKITIIPEFDADLIVKSDNNMISTVIRNLISNAIKFTETNGIINIRTSINNGFVRVSVIDNGIGISSENLKKLFRLDASYKRYGTRDEKGSGFGLIICKEFIEKMGGEINVISKPGEGSEFYFTIPAK